MAFTNRIAWEPIRILLPNQLSAVYVPFDSPLAFPSYILKMVNTTEVDLYISVDGVNDYDICPAGSFFLYDEYKDLGREALQKGTLFSVKIASGEVVQGSGRVYLVSQYLITN